MDTFELTRPILSDTRHVLAEARRYVHQLPLGVWSGPAFDGGRWSPAAAARGIERALVRAAAVTGVAVGINDTPDAVARRLVQCRVIVAPAADGALALLQVLRHPDDAGDAAKLAERLIGYLDHRPYNRFGWAHRLHRSLGPPRPIQRLGIQAGRCCS